MRTDRIYNRVPGKGGNKPLGPASPSFLTAHWPLLRVGGWENDLLLTPVRQRVADVAMFTRLAQNCRMPLQRTESAKTILKWFGYLRLLTLDGLNIH